MACDFTPFQVLSPFLSKKTTPMKRSKIDTKRSQKKNSKTRKLGMRCFVPIKAARQTFPQPSAKTAVPATITTVTGSFTFTPQNEHTQNLCSPSVKMWPFTSPSHSNWSDIEEDWDGERQEKEERRNK